jgi:nucleoside-diphosphate-sugar epimerase
MVVTGSSGKLGSVVVQDLLSAGHEVVPIDVRPPSHPAPLETHVVDLTRVDALVPLFRGAQAICHLGNLPGIEKWPLTDGFINNVGANHAVFEAALSVGIRKIAYASSIQAYGVLPNPWRPIKPSTPRYLPIDEDHPLLPADAYPLSKAMGEWTVESFCRQEPQLQAFSLRFTFIARPRSDPQKPHRPSKPPPYIGGSLLTRVQVQDAARACRLACEVERRGHTPLNILASQSATAWESDWIRELYGTLPEFRRALGPMDPLFSAERAREILGFQAEPPADSQASFLKAAPL